MGKDVIKSEWLKEIKRQRKINSKNHLSLCYMGTIGKPDSEIEWQGNEVCYSNLDEYIMTQDGELQYAVVDIHGMTCCDDIDPILTRGQTEWLEWLYNDSLWKDYYSLNLSANDMKYGFIFKINPNMSHKFHAIGMILVRYTFEMSHIVTRWYDRVNTGFTPVEALFMAHYDICGDSMGNGHTMWENPDFPEKLGWLKQQVSEDGNLPYLESDKYIPGLSSTWYSPENIEPLIMRQTPETEGEWRELFDEIGGVA